MASYWQGIRKRAWRDVVELFRWDNPWRVMIWLAPIIAAGVGLYVGVVAGLPFQTLGTAAIIALLALLAFAWKMASLPAVLAAEAEARHKSEMDGLRAERDLAILERDAARTEITELRKPAPPPARDPDGVYQFGRIVGRVVAPRVEASAGLVLCDQIFGAADLNTDQQFEYRDFVLRLSSSNGEAMANMSGRRERCIHGARCQIIDRK